MIFPDPYILNIVESLKKDTSLEQSDIVTEQIDKLSLIQKIQFYCLAKDLTITSKDLFSLERTIWENFHDLFRNDYSRSPFLLQNVNASLTLAETALFTDQFDLEDYRTITRYLYTNTSDYYSTILKINRGLLHFLHLQGVGSQVLPKFSSFLRYLGVPLARIGELKPVFYKLFPDAKNQLDTFYELPIDSCQLHSEYVSELAEHLIYDQEFSILKSWLDHETLSKLESESLAQFVRSWKPETIKSVEDLISALKVELSKKNLSTIPIVFDSLIKPFSKHLEPRKVKTTDIYSNIPKEIIPTYIEKLAYPIKSKKSDKIQILFLGGAKIGSMAILIRTPQSNVLIDYGMSVANYQIPAWHEALNHLDAVLVTHAHLDHIGAIPLLYGLGYKGYVFGSGMTKNLSKFLLTDSFELMKRNINVEARENDYRFKHLSNPSNVYQMLDRYLILKSKKEYQISPDITINTFPACHIQGSFAYLIECGEKQSKKILFSGDINLDPSTLFNEKIPDLPIDADLTIMDSTYYGQPAFSSEKSDKILVQAVKEAERVIIPAFSVGRAQEIMMKLEKYGLTKERKITMLGMATKVARVSGLKTKG
ncbi:MAG: MBL fold metallo-hydrolase, partial [Candidatus Hodarchaeales archaeon]